jgi:hypothetical protein
VARLQAGPVEVAVAVEHAAALAAALGYADSGLRVLPCDASKRPATRHGLKDATSDPEAVARLWRSTPGVNVALVVPAGVVVLDLDHDPSEGLDGLAALRDLAPAGEVLDPERWPGPVARTPRGGWHLWALDPRPSGSQGNGRGALPVGVDVRAGGRGYLLAFPSATARGAYRWVRPLGRRDALPALPGWLAALLQAPALSLAARAAPDLAAPGHPAPLPAAAASGAPDAREEARRRAYAARACELAEEEVAAAPAGARHETLLARALGLGSLVGGGVLDRGQAEAALTRGAARASRVMPEAPGTIRDGLDRGARSPRGLPPREEREAMTRPARPSRPATSSDAPSDPVEPLPEPASKRPRGRPRKSPGEPAEEGQRGGPPARDVLLSLALAAGIIAWRNPDGEPWIDVPHPGGVLEAMPIGQRGPSRALLGRLYYEGQGRPAPSTAVGDALEALAAVASGPGAPVRAVHLRVAAQPDRVALDLGDGSGRVVLVTRDGWTIGPCPDDLRFRRSGGSLPEPVRGGRPAAEAVGDLLPGLDDDGRVLAAAWLVSVLLPAPGALPILVLGGPQGSGKSTAARVLRWTIDPTQTVAGAIGGKPNKVDDLAARAKHNAVLALDNLTFIGDELSDALCACSTAGDLGGRMYYTNDDVARNPVRRSVILTGIGDVARNADLLDRCIALRLPALDRREPEAALWARVDALRPALLGRLLDAVALALRDRDRFDCHGLRLADFAAWAQAAAPALGFEPARFVDAYQRNRGEAAAALVADDPLAEAVTALAENRGALGWSGTPTQLLAELNRRVGQEDRPRRTWPETGAALGRWLTRQAPALLEGQGVEAIKGKSHGAVVWRIRPAARGAGSGGQDVSTCPPSYPRLPAASREVDPGGQVGRDETDTSISSPVNPPMVMAGDFSGKNYNGNHPAPPAHPAPRHEPVDDGDEEVLT